MNVDETTLRRKAKHEQDSKRERARRLVRNRQDFDDSNNNKNSCSLLQRSPLGTTIHQTTTQTDQHNTMTY